MFKVAVAQIVIEESLEKNYIKICSYIKAAKQESVELIVFPESCLTGYLGISLTSLNKLELCQINDYIKKISGLCKEQKIGCVIGQYLLRCGKWYNNILFIGSDGQCKCSYDKSHLVDEDTFYVTPGEAPVCFTYNNIIFSLGICHDIRYSEHFMNVAAQGAQVHIHPFYGVRKINFQKVQKAYDAMVTTRAIENGLFILAPNVANTEQMIRSQILAPDGEVLVKATSADEQLLISTINISLAGRGWFLRRRSDLYKFDVIKPNRLSFFERGYWQKESYMTDHNQELLNNINCSTEKITLVFGEKNE